MRSTKCYDNPWRDTIICRTCAYKEICPAEKDSLNAIKQALTSIVRIVPDSHFEIVKFNVEIILEKLKNLEETK